MTCERCERPMAEGETTCASCGHVHSPQLASRAAETIVFRPDQLGLPGELEHGLPGVQPGPAPSTGGQGRRWLWGIVALALVGGLGAGAYVFLVRDPGTAVVVAPTPAASPTPVGTPATPEPTPAPTTTNPTPTPEPSAEPVLPEPKERGFFLVHSGSRNPIPDPVRTVPERAWEAALGGEAQTVVADEDVVVITTRTDGGFQLEAFDAATGQQRWTRAIDPGQFPWVALADTIVVSTITQDPAESGAVFGLDRLTGEDRWHAVADGQPFPVRQADGRVLLSGANSAAVVDATTGDVAPLVEGDLIRLGTDAVAGFTDGTVTVVDLADASPRYELFVGPIHEGGDFVFTGDRVIVDDGDTIWSIDTVGQREWDYNPVDAGATTRVLTLLPDGSLLVTTSGADGTFALDPTTGEVRWRIDGFVDGVGSFNGDLRGVRVADEVQVVDFAGDVAAFADGGGQGNGFSNGLYYAHDPSGITARSLDDGSALWTVELPGTTDRHAIPGGIVVALGSDRIALLR